MQNLPIIRRKLMYIMFDFFSEIRLVGGNNRMTFKSSSIKENDNYLTKMLRRVTLN